MMELGHMSVAEIFICESAYTIICFLIEVPTGAIADTIGTKKTILMGRIIFVVAYIFMALMTSSTMVWIGNILWAIALSLESGADQAFLYRTLKDSGEEGQYKKILGKAVGYRLFVVMITSLIVSYLCRFGIRTPLLLGIPFILMSLVPVFMMTEPICHENGVRKSGEYFRTIVSGLSSITNSRELCWIFLFSILLGTISKIWFFTYNPYFALAKIPVTYFGFIFFGLNLVAWLSSIYAGQIENAIGERWVIIILMSVLSIPIIIMGLIVTWQCALLVLFQNIVRGLSAPFVSGYINTRCESESYRATILSVKSSASSLVSTIGLVIFSLALRHYNLDTCLIALGSIALVSGALCYVRYITITKRE